MRAFKTLTLKIGHAYKGTKKHQHLLQKSCPDVIDIDYSFNEVTEWIDRIKIGKDTIIHAYSFTDLIAEKIRAILQQEVRNRVRRQDSYDIYRLLTIHPITDNQQKKSVLENLLTKATSRDLAINKRSMSDSKIMARSRKEYAQLKQEIEEALPPFEKGYGKVKDFYESLPWQ